jgi:hypothetical protein
MYKAARSIGPDIKRTHLDLIGCIQVVENCNERQLPACNRMKLQINRNQSFARHILQLKGQY